MVIKFMKILYIKNNGPEEDVDALDDINDLQS
jgi:hypothetical protein